MTTTMTRRGWLSAASSTLGAGLAGSALTAARARGAAVSAEEPFGYCLNTSTISGQKLPIDQVVALAAQAGYQGIEPWIRELEQYAQSGKSLRDLGQRIEDLGLSVASVIGFFEWAVDDDARRRKGLDDARRSFALAHAIGGQRLAAPPVGMTDRDGADPRRLAERYRALLELGAPMGVVPEVEVWGFSKTLGRLSEAAHVAIESGHPSACVLPDVFHLYKGGSSFRGVRLLGPLAIGVFHFNDYPAHPPRDQINDSQRVYPGDGVAPLDVLVRDLRDIGYRGMLSLELFNRDYWRQDPLEVARTGLEKMKAVVRRGLA
jgi:2-keto-myo-inositol isomerase